MWEMVLWPLQIIRATLCKEASESLSGRNPHFVGPIVYTIDVKDSCWKSTQYFEYKIKYRNTEVNIYLEWEIKHHKKIANFKMLENKANIIKGKNHNDFIT